jgi:hypothetical protein
VTGIVLILLGLAIGAAGVLRFRGPWGRYQALKAQESNIARYESWRGGVRDTGQTGASVAMDMARGQARNAGIVIAAGAVVAILGILQL